MKHIAGIAGAAIVAAALMAPCSALADELAPCDGAVEDEWTVDASETSAYYEPPAAVDQGGAQTINAYDGVYWYGDRLETFYSSSVLYHWRTPEWWVDGQGFYRTDEGYYVVAASDYEQGAVIEGSMGLCQVLDSGCPAGVTDYYVCGW